MNMYNPSGNMYGQPVSGNHSDRMEIAAMTLGIISIVSCTCLYLAIPCGALAIILASLSRGGQMSTAPKRRSVSFSEFSEFSELCLRLSFIFRRLHLHCTSTEVSKVFSKPTPT